MRTGDLIQHQKPVVQRPFTCDFLNGIMNCSKLHFPVRSAVETATPGISLDSPFYTNTVSNVKICLNKYNSTGTTAKKCVYICNVPV